MSVIIAIFYTVIVLSFLVIIHELGHFFAAKWAKIKTEEFGIGYPPVAKKLFRWWDTDFTLNWIPFGGFVRMQGEEEQGEELKEGDFGAASITRRLVVILAGASVNFLFGIIAFAGLFSYFGIPTLVDDARIGMVMEESPAQEAGLQEGTAIVAISVFGETFDITNTQEAIDTIAGLKGQSIDMTVVDECNVECTGAERTISGVYIRTEDETPEGHGALGIVFENAVPVFYPWWEMPIRSTWYGLQQAVAFSGLILTTLGNLVSNLFTQGQIPKDISGPVGIVDQAVQFDMFAGGWISVLEYAGILSINLAIMNVLPLLPLDGGKAVVTVLELFFDRKKIFNFESKLSQVGFLFFVGLLLIITFKDIFVIIQREWLS